MLYRKMKQTLNVGNHQMAPRPKRETREERKKELWLNNCAWREYQKWHLKQKKTKENSNQINIQKKIERNTSFKRPKERAKALKRPYPPPLPFR
jgi:hypothetical protein